MTPGPTLNPIEPKAARWEPTPDPNDIVIPGLNTSAPAGDQIEQIEQLITIKLQNIDANFSKIQQIMANRILPSVKRYAVSTEPVREAAKFWTTFFEQAAQIRVPTYDDYAAPAEQSAEGETETQDPTSANEEDSDGTSSRSFNPDGTSSEVSFMPGQAAISSTPATTPRHRAHSYGADMDPTPSWSASLESPLIRLDREIQSLTREDEVSAASSSMANLSLDDDDSADITQRVPQMPNVFQNPASSSKGKGKETQLLRQNVLLRNAAAADISATPGGSQTATSPLKVKGRTPNLKVLNPYILPHSNPADWKGVVDLKDPSVATPRRTHVPSRRYQPPAGKGSATPGPSEDDSFDFGMSPPITMDFARLPKLGQTPRKEAAERIMKSLVDVQKRGGFGGAKQGAESSMSTVPTPPSLSRYIHPVAEASSSSVADASLESLMRRVGDGFGTNYGAPNASSGTSITSSIAPALTSLPSVGSRELSQTIPQPKPTSPPTIVPLTPDPPPFSVFRLQDDELQHPSHEGLDPDLSSDSSFEEEMHNTANPSAAFLLASQRASYDDDDSFDSSNQSMDSLDGEAIDVDAPVHPFARGLVADDGDGDGFDDSFDDPVYGHHDGEEETLFGVPPAQRLLAQAQAQDAAINLRMLGEELLEDTMGIGAQMARAGRVEESPTPWGARG